MRRIRTPTVVRNGLSDCCVRDMWRALESADPPADAHRTRCCGLLLERSAGNLWRLTPEAESKLPVGARLTE